jgi:hypothetical protein
MLMDDPTKISLSSRTSVIEASDLKDATVPPEPKTTPQIVSLEIKIGVPVITGGPVPPRKDLEMNLTELIEQAEKIKKELIEVIEQAGKVIAQPAISK